MEEDKEKIQFGFRGGYWNSNEITDIPDEAILSPSSNIIYTRTKKPISIKDFNLITASFGGSRIFTLDSNLTGALGNNGVSGKAVGNMLLGSGKNLWFVGNSLANSVKVNSGASFETPIAIGGTRQIETLSLVFSGASATSGSFNLTIAGIYITGSPILISVSTTGGQTISQVRDSTLALLRANTAITDQYHIYSSTTNAIVFKDKLIRANDTTLQLSLPALNTSGLNSATSANTTLGALDYAADLSTTPQLAKWNGTYWNNPVQIGLAAQTEVCDLALTTDATKDSYFTGIIEGSTSGRIARKRNGTISIASAPSNVVTGTGNSCYVYIPAYPEDGSLLSEKNWVLYFTYKGKGSQAAHFMFPIDIPESKLDGTDAIGWTTTIGNARIKVKSQHATSKSSRIVEVEFYDNDLLLFEPFEDYYSAGSCKFLAQLGNSMCLIGSGTESTAFDVSYPNNREAFPPQWREWFSEVPVAIATSSEQGLLWIQGANTTYQAIWTGATQQTAPIILRQVSAKLGCIGEGASVSVNGVLYFLSSGKTPVRVSPDREIDSEFGRKVLGAFFSFDSSTKIEYDEINNSIVWCNGMTTIAYQIDNDIWGSLSNLTGSGNITVDTNYNGIHSLSRLNGKLYASVDVDSSTYSIYEYNAHTSSTISWSIYSKFETGKLGILLKDLIEARYITESTFQPYTIQLLPTKNWDTSNIGSSISTASITTTKPKTSRRFLLERLDYESIGVKIQGQIGGITPLLVEFTIDWHKIERE